MEVGGEIGGLVRVDHDCPTTGPVQAISNSIPSSSHSVCPCKTTQYPTLSAVPNSRSLTSEVKLSLREVPDKYKYGDSVKLSIS